MNLFRKIGGKIKFELRMSKMDREWRMLGGGCFGDYPPSFYYRHTPEEVERIQAEDRKAIMEILDKMEK